MGKASDSRSKISRWQCLVPVLLMVCALFLPGELGAQGHLFSTIPAVELQGGKGDLLTGWSRWCDDFCFMAASARVPHGAKVIGIEIDACRDTSNDLVLGYGIVRRLPHDQTTGSPPFPWEYLLVGQFNSVGCFYRNVAAQSPIEVDLFTGELLVYVYIGDLLCGVLGHPPCPDQGSRVQALRVYYEPSPEGTVEPTKRSAISIFN